MLLRISDHIIGNSLTGYWFIQHWVFTYLFHFALFITGVAYFSFRTKSITFRVKPITFAIVIIISPFNVPYKIHKENPVIREIISHFDTSSVLLVLSYFLIWGTVFQRLNKVADMPVKDTRYSFILPCSQYDQLSKDHRINPKESLSSKLMYIIIYNLRWLLKFYIIK